MPPPRAPGARASLLLLLLALVGGSGVAMAQPAADPDLLFALSAPARLAPGETQDVNVALVNGLRIPVAVRLELTWVTPGAGESLNLDHPVQEFTLAARASTVIPLALTASGGASPGKQEGIATLRYWVDGEQREQVSHFTVEVAEENPFLKWLRESMPLIVGAAAVGGLVGLIAFLRWWDWRYLSGALAAPLYTRLRSSELLDQDRRRLVYDAIAESPGIHFSALQRRTGLRNGVLYHHLRLLETSGLVVSRRSVGRRLFSLAGREMVLPAMELSPAERTLLDLIPEEGIPQVVLAERLGISRQGVNYHVRNLVEKGAVRVHQVDGDWRCFRTEGPAGRP